MSAASSVKCHAPGGREIPPTKPLPTKQPDPHANKIHKAAAQGSKASLSSKQVTTTCWGKLKNCIQKIVQFVLAPFKAIISFFRWFFVGSKTTAPSQPKPAEKSETKPASVSVPSVVEPKQEIKTFYGSSNLDLTASTNNSEILESAEEFFPLAGLQELWKHLKENQILTDETAKNLIDMAITKTIAEATHPDIEERHLSNALPHLREGVYLNIETFRSHLSNIQGLTGVICESENRTKSFFLLFDGRKESGIFYLGFPREKLDNGTTMASIKVMTNFEEVLKEARVQCSSENLFLQLFNFQAEISLESAPVVEPIPKSPQMFSNPFPILSLLSSYQIPSSEEVGVAMNRGDIEERAIQSPGTFTGNTSIENSLEAKYVTAEEGPVYLLPLQKVNFPLFCAFHTLYYLWTALERGMILTHETTGGFIDEVIRNAFLKASENGAIVEKVLDPNLVLREFPLLESNAGKSLFTKSPMVQDLSKEEEITGFIWKEDDRNSYFALFNNRGERPIGYFGFAKVEKENARFPAIQVGTPEEIIECITRNQKKLTTFCGKTPIADGLKAKKVLIENCYIPLVQTQRSNLPYFCAVHGADRFWEAIERNAVLKPEEAETLIDTAIKDALTMTYGPPSNAGVLESLTPVDLGTILSRFPLFQNLVPKKPRTEDLRDAIEEISDKKGISGFIWQRDTGDRTPYFVLLDKRRETPIAYLGFKEEEGKAAIQAGTHEEIFRFLGAQLTDSWHTASLLPLKRND